MRKRIAVLTVLLVVLLILIEWRTHAWIAGAVIPVYVGAAVLVHRRARVADGAGADKLMRIWLGVTMSILMAINVVGMIRKRTLGSTPQSSPSSSLNPPSRTAH